MPPKLAMLSATSILALAFAATAQAEVAAETAPVGGMCFQEIVSLGGSKAFKLIQDKRLTMDFTTSYRLLPDWTIYFNGRNLTNELLRFYYGEGKSFPIQRAIYDVTFEGGIWAILQARQV